jgi:ABC-type dipeptide/oligopeptide/nickel transport system permease subunit
MTGGFIVFVLIVVGLLAPLIAPRSQRQNPARRSGRQTGCSARTARHRAVGRDISRLFYGARISLVIAVLVVLISAARASFGAISATSPASHFDPETGQWCGRSRRCLQVAIMAFLGRGLENLILAQESALAATPRRADRHCRPTRVQDAARSLGAEHTRILLHHAEPVPPAVVIGTPRLPPSSRKRR